MKSSFCSCAGDIQCLVDYIILFGIIWTYLVIFPRIGGTIYGTFQIGDQKPMVKKQTVFSLYPLAIYNIAMKNGSSIDHLSIEP